MADPRPQVRDKNNHSGHGPSHRTDPSKAVKPMTTRLFNRVDVQEFANLHASTDGRTPFEVYWDVHFLGNSRLAPCSKILKQRPARRWLQEHADPAATTVYVGIDA